MVSFLKKKNINFVYETKKWSIYDDGFNISKYNKKLILSKFPIILPLKIKIIHFGSINLFFKYKFILPIIKKLNIRIVCSWFHIDDSNKNFKKFSTIYSLVDKWHVTNLNIKNSLVGFGIDPNKIHIINLGYEEKIFYKIKSTKINELKKKFNVPNKLIFGSFVKDSPGFGGSIEPKSIKQPDLLIKILNKIKLKKEIFIILSGPSRGYVLQHLKKNNIDHLYLGNISKIDLANIMNIIDINIISSLREGGPKSAIETTACNKFLLSTDVGIVPDLIKNFQNGYIFFNEYDFDLDIFLKKYYAFNNITNIDYLIEHYSWKNISKKYFRLLYS